MAQLHETMMGKKLIEYTLPEIAFQLKRIADVLERTTDKDRENDALIKAAKAYLNVTSSSS